MVSITNLSKISEKLEIRPNPSKGGLGVFAKAFIQKSEIVAIASGKIADINEIVSLPYSVINYVLQIDEDFFLLPLKLDDPFFLINHSCSPNLGFKGQISLVALRDIQPDEEVCYDYAMSDGYNFGEDSKVYDIVCKCGSDECRSIIADDDWKLPELRKKYKGFYSSYIEKRFENNKEEIAEVKSPNLYQ